jgi:hypothetical protein
MRFADGFLEAMSSQHPLTNEQWESLQPNSRALLDALGVKSVHALHLISHVRLAWYFDNLQLLPKHPQKMAESILQEVSIDVCRLYWRMHSDRIRKLCTQFPALSSRMFLSFSPQCIASLTHFSILFSTSA